MKPTVTILDDYQNVALGYADWSRVQERFDLDVVTEHIADPEALVDRLATARSSWRCASGPRSLPPYSRNCLR